MSAQGTTWPHKDPKHCGMCGRALAPDEARRDAGFNVETGAKLPPVLVEYRRCPSWSADSQMAHHRWRLLDSGEWWLA